MAFTGFYFGFPFTVMEALVKLTGADAAEARKFFRGPKSQVVEGAPRVTFDSLIRNSEKLFPSGTELARISVPARANGAFTLSGLRSGNPALRGRTGAYVDQYSGKVLASFDSREQSPGMRLALMFRPIHFGLWGGIWAKGPLVPARLCSRNSHHHRLPDVVESGCGQALSRLATVVPGNPGEGRSGSPANRYRRG